MPREKGFTIVEILVTLAIAGLLALIGIPAFKNYQPDLELSGTVQGLVGDLRYAQQLAVTEQVEHGIRFFIVDRKYQIIRYGNPEEVLKSQALPAKVSFQEIDGLTNDQVIFNPYGAVKEAGQVSLINTKNSTTTIDIRPSGFVKIIK